VHLVHLDAPVPIKEYPSIQLEAAVGDVHEFAPIPHYVHVFAVGS